MIFMNTLQTHSPVELKDIPEIGPYIGTLLLKYGFTKQQLNNRQLKWSVVNNELFIDILDAKDINKENK